MRISIALLALIFILKEFTVNAQSPVLIKEIKIPSAKLASLDQRGNTYLVLENEDILKYDSDGNLLSRYSPSHQAEVTVLDVWQEFHLFVFYESVQEYVYLDQYLVSHGGRTFGKDAGYVLLAVPSRDNRIWILDANEYALKKIDANTHQIILNSPLEMIAPALSEITFMKEYQNHLYIGEVQKGIHVFDQMGNYLKTIKINKFYKPSFWKEWVCYIHENTIWMHHIYENEKYKQIPLPTQNDSGFIFISGTKAHLISDSHLKFFRLN